MDSTAKDYALLARLHYNVVTERDSLHADLAAAMECLREVANSVGEVPTKKAQTKDFPSAEVDWDAVAKIHAFLGRTK